MSKQAITNMNARSKKEGYRSACAVAEGKDVSDEDQRPNEDSSGDLEVLQEGRVESLGEFV